MKETGWLLFASVCRFGVFQLNFRMEEEVVVQWNTTSFSNSFLVGSKMGKVFIPWFRHQINNAYHPFQQQIQHGAFPLGWVSLSCILWVGCLNLDLLSGVKIDEVCPANDCESFSVIVAGNCTSELVAFPAWFSFYKWYWTISFVCQASVAALDATIFDIAPYS